MGTDFFDGLVKTFSKTTKELGKTTRELGARAEQTHSCCASGVFIGARTSLSPS